MSQRLPVLVEPDLDAGQLEKLIEILWTNETPAALIIREGRPKDVIVQEARASNAEMIVMSAHQHVGWRRVLRRNTAAYVMRQTPCPVLIVRAEAALNSKDRVR
jgi:nucleotide-binding universal stress UspA family protein